MIVEQYDLNSLNLNRKQLNDTLLSYTYYYYIILYSYTYLLYFFYCYCNKRNHHTYNSKRTLLYIVIYYCIMNCTMYLLYIDVEAINLFILVLHLKFALFTVRDTFFSPFDSEFFLIL